jgi:Bacteriophage tail sheath protein
MAPFSAVNKTPGVYIEEVQLPGAIAGVGTSTAAFLGPARRGPTDEPVFLTNWTEFLNAFGPADPGDPLGPYIANPPVYVTHAVRGFFDNGGTSCYFVRVGTGARAWLTLKDRSAAPGLPALIVTALQEGTDGNGITVDVTSAHIVASVDVERPDPAGGLAAAAAANQATVSAAEADKALKFRPGDVVLISETVAGVTSTDKMTVNRVSKDPVAGTAAIRFAETLAHAYAAGEMRMADLAPGQRRIRIADVTGVEPGSSIGITQGAGAGQKTEWLTVQSVEPSNNAITVAAGLTKLYTMDAADPAVTVQTQEFTLVFTQSGTPETFENLAMDPRHSRYFATIINSAYVQVALADPPSPTPAPNNRPAEIAATHLAGGKSDDLAQIQPLHYHNAIDTLEKVDDVNILCIPDSAALDEADAQDVQAAMIAHCEKMQDRFTVLDARKGLDPAGIRTQRNGLSSDGGYGALYYPWIVISNPVGPGRITIAPSGHVAGLYARVDDARGVHKAPANETLRGVLDLERILSDDEQGPLNEQGVNVIRSFPGSGLRVWGARTIAPRDRIQWRYVNVRRLLLFIEESIQEGTQFAVFEPNEIGLWQKVKRQVADFLTRVWKDGALFGDTAEQAFRVRVDEELNPPSVRQLGQLIIEVVLYPTTPAEFVVFRIIQQPGGPVVQE